MRHRHFITLLVLLASAFTALAQDGTEPTDNISSATERLLQNIDLPYLKITTTSGADPTFETVVAPEGCMGQSITGNNYLTGKICLLKNADTLYNSGDYSKNASGMKVRVRGNTSATYNPDVPPLKVKLEKKADLLLRGNEVYKDKNWVLLNYVSSIELKTQVGFDVARLAGMEWQPACEPVNVLLNGRYLGLYLLCETVKDGEGRCHVDPTGYIVEADPYWWNTDEPYFKTDLLPYAIGYTFKYPDGDDLNNELTERMENYIAAFEDALSAGGDIAEYIDLESFAAWMLTHDVLGTSDGAGSNIFLYKKDYDPAAPTATKLRLGPVWDLNSAFRRPGAWSTIHQNDFYFDYLFKRQDFVEAYKAKWAELRENLYGFAAHKADSIAVACGAAVNQSRELTEELTQYPYVSIEDNVTEVKDWFAERIPWMDEAVAALDFSLGAAQTHAAGEPVKAEVYDLDGRLCASYECASARNARMWAKKRLQKGIYVIHYWTDEGTAAHTEKLLVP